MKIDEKNKLIKLINIEKKYLKKNKKNQNIIVSKNGSKIKGFSPSNPIQKLSIKDYSLGIDEDYNI